MTPEQLAETLDDMHFWIDSGHQARPNLDRLVAEITRLQGELDAVRDRLDVERKEHIEEMRDAGRDYREMQSEIDALQREREGW